MTLADELREAALECTDCADRESHAKAIGALHITSIRLRNAADCLDALEAERDPLKETVDHLAEVTAVRCKCGARMIFDNAAKPFCRACQAESALAALRAAEPGKSRAAFISGGRWARLWFRSDESLAVEATRRYPDPPEGQP